MNIIKRAIEFRRERGNKALFMAGKDIIMGILFDQSNPVISKSTEFRRFIGKETEFNIVFHANVEEEYDPKKKNVLLSMGTPVGIEYQDLIKDEMEFHAEISFQKQTDANHHHCPRRLYATHDGWLELDLDNEYNQKENLISIIYSEKEFLEGHKLRHQIVDRYGDQLDKYGSGTGRGWEPKSEALESYMFQVVVENGGTPEYVSEKFYDALKTKTVPIYWGGKTGVQKMGFDTDGVLFFDTPDDLPEILDSISEEKYEEMRDAIEYNRKRLVEIRNEMRADFFLNTNMLGYMHTYDSFRKGKHSELNLGFEQLPDSSSSE